MPRQLVLYACIAFIFYLFWNDRKNNSNYSPALWIPFIWMFLAGSRYLGAWLTLHQVTDIVEATAEAYTEGSPIDQLAFGFLIIAGLIVLFRRKPDWAAVFGKNKWVWLYFLYCCLSIMWADDSFVSFKRIIKELGNMVMLLVILSEEKPFESLGVILKRMGFIILPLSIVFIRFYPEWGRAYDMEGSPMYTGVAQQKNGLGKSCLIIGIYFAWYYFLQKKESFRWLSKDNIINYLLIVMLLWLLYISRSATSLACFVVALGLLLSSRLSAIRRKPDVILPLLIFCSFTLFLMEYAINISDMIIRMLGRNPTLTSRTGVWETLTGYAANPLIGTGYMSFWSGERLSILWREIGGTIIQAHNGYLEQYLNLGIIGVGFIIIIILNGLRNIHRQFSKNFTTAMFSLTIIVVAILYNYTEAAFYGINNIWILLLLAVMEHPGSSKTIVPSTISS
jgi:O-antigen ligase